MFKTLCVISIVLCGTVAVSSATPFTMDGKTVELESWTVNLDSWTPTASQVILVLDYNDVQDNSGNGGIGNDTYYFGYIWDGSTKTVWDMMSDIEASNSALTVHSHNDWGSPFVTGWAYSADDYTAIWDATYNEYVSEWISDDGDTWTYGAGVSADTISNGGWVGMVFQYSGSNDTPATPEPATMTLLALGGLAILKRRRRKA